MTEHIDENRLTEDLRTGNSSIDSGYCRFQFDITKQFFVLRNDGFDGQLKIDEILTLDSTQMTYRRDMLSVYLKRLLLQREWTDDFLQYLSHIGRIHTNNIGSTSIHINVTLSYIETQMIDAIWTIESIENKNKKEILLALNKVFRIQNDLFLLHYLQPSKETNKSTNHKTHKCPCFFFLNKNSNNNRKQD